jgi:large subunit ribosomal protein L21e
MPHRRFQGKVGIIMDVGRRTLKISIKIGEKQKILQTKLNHVKPLATSLKDGRTD